MTADTGDERPDAQGAADEASEAEAPAEPLDEAPQEPAAEDELTALRAERDQLFQRIQRVSAEFDNFQKRVKREKAKWTQETVRDVLEGFLPVLDNLDYAVAAFDREGADLGSLRQGVELVREEFRRQLSNRGVERIEDAEGTPYDPDRHLAIGMQEVGGIDQEVVAYVARPGYAMGDAVLRPAQVGVSKPAREE